MSRISVGDSELVEPLDQGVVMIGHSTGCQDAVRYLARHKEATDAARVLGVILQAPVSSSVLLSAGASLV